MALRLAQTKLAAQILQGFTDTLSDSNEGAHHSNPELFIEHLELAVLYLARSYRVLCGYDTGRIGIGANAQSLNSVGFLECAKELLDAVGETSQLSPSLAELKKIAQTEGLQDKSLYLAILRSVAPMVYSNRGQLIEDAQAHALFDAVQELDRLIDENFPERGIIAQQSNWERNIEKDVLLVLGEFEYNYAIAAPSGAVESDIWFALSMIRQGLNDAFRPEPDTELQALRKQWATSINRKSPATDAFTSREEARAIDSGGWTAASEELAHALHEAPERKEAIKRHEAANHPTTLSFETGYNDGTITLTVKASNAYRAPQPPTTDELLRGFKRCKDECLEAVERELSREWRYTRRDGKGKASRNGLMGMERQMAYEYDAEDLADMLRQMLPQGEKDLVKQVGKNQDRVWIHPDAETRVRMFLEIGQIEPLASRRPVR